MIFVTVGTQLPFDRLIRAVDEWAATRGIHDVVAQIGPSLYKGRAIECVQFLEPPEFERYFSSAELIVAHAGMGTILSALQNGWRLIVMPRRASLGEHRNDHQMGTAQRFAELGKVSVAVDEEELTRRLDDYHTLTTSEPISSYASEQLTTAIRGLIESSGPLTYARQS